MCDIPLFALPTSYWILLVFTAIKYFFYSVSTGTFICKFSIFLCHSRMSTATGNSNGVFLCDNLNSVYCEINKCLYLLTKNRQYTIHIPHTNLIFIYNINDCVCIDFYYKCQIGPENELIAQSKSNH